MLLTNYHTHHDRCKHAKGDVEAYVKEAVKHNYAEIGMSVTRHIKISLRWEHVVWITLS